MTPIVYDPCYHHTGLEPLCQQLSPHEQFSIGRAMSCHIRVRDTCVSGKHCCIILVRHSLRHNGAPETDPPHEVRQLQAQTNVCQDCKTPLRSNRSTGGHHVPSRSVVIMYVVDYSSNGTYVDDERLVKGIPYQLLPTQTVSLCRARGDPTQQHHDHAFAFQVAMTRGTIDGRNGIPSSRCRSLSRDPPTRHIEQISSQVAQTAGDLFSTGQWSTNISSSNSVPSSQLKKQSTHSSDRTAPGHSHEIPSPSEVLVTARNRFRSPPPERQRSLPCRHPGSAYNLNCRLSPTDHKDTQRLFPVFPAVVSTRTTADITCSCSQTTRSTSPTINRESFAILKPTPRPLFSDWNSRFQLEINETLSESPVLSSTTPICQAHHLRLSDKKMDSNQPFTYRLQSHIDQYSTPGHRTTELQPVAQAAQTTSYIPLRLQTHLHTWEQAHQDHESRSSLSPIHSTGRQCQQLIPRNYAPEVQLMSDVFDSANKQNDPEHIWCNEKLKPDQKTVPESSLTNFFPHLVQKDLLTTHRHDGKGQVNTLNKTNDVTLKEATPFDVDGISEIAFLTKRIDPELVAQALIYTGNVCRELLIRWKEAQKDVKAEQLRTQRLASLLGTIYDNPIRPEIQANMLHDQVDILNARILHLMQQLEETEQKYRRTDNINSQLLAQLTSWKTKYEQCSDLKRDLQMQIQSLSDKSLQMAVELEAQAHMIEAQKTVAQHVNGFLRNALALSGKVGNPRSLQHILNQEIYTEDELFSKLTDDKVSQTATTPSSN